MATVAIIAHDRRKDEMVQFAQRHREKLLGFRLVATSSTGKLLQAVVGLEVDLLGHGPEGGDVIIAAEVIRKRVQMVLFFVEPRDVHPHDPDIKTLLRACDLHNVPLATNEATAELLLRGFILQHG